MLEGGWTRPLTDLSTTPGTEQRAQRGELAERILRAAERQVFQVEMNPTAPAAAFARAVRLLKLAQSLDRPGQPRSAGETGSQTGPSRRKNSSRNDVL